MSSPFAKLVDCPHFGQTLQVKVTNCFIFWFSWDQVCDASRGVKNEVVGMKSCVFLVA